MVSRLVSISVTGILILVVIGAIWQVAPVSAGFTPTPSPGPTDTPVPTNTPVPPTATPDTPDTPVPPTVPPVPPTATPPLLLPPTGGQASGLSNIEAIAVLLAGMLGVLLVAFSLVIRKSARTESG